MKKRGTRRVFKTGMMAILSLVIIAALTKEETAQAVQSFPFFTTPEEYGAAGDGIQDDTVAINTALASLAPGERLLLTGMYLIDSANVSIPSNVTFEGTFEAVGTSLNNLTEPYASLNSAIILNPVYTISLGGGSAIKGLLIRRKDQVFPAADATGFNGTAITVAGDDASVIGCMILAFDLGIYSSGYQRQYYNHILGDNLNFIEVTGSTNVGRIVDCHAWPFVTIAYPSKPSNSSYRNTAYYIHDNADWFKMTNCFAISYLNGILLNNTNSVTLLGCGVDGREIPASNGISVLGNCTDIRLNACQVAAQANAIFTNNGPGLNTQIVNCNFWGNSGNGANSTDIYIESGDVQITGGCRFSYGNGYAIYIKNSASHVLIEGNSFNQNTPSPIFNQAQSPYVQVGLNYYGNFPTGSSVVANMVSPSATVGTGVQSNVLLLPSSGDVFSIPATTGNFQYINGSFDGRVKTLIFKGALTIGSSRNPNGVYLTNGTSLTTAAGSSLSVIFTPGGYWVETGRCQ